MHTVNILGYRHVAGATRGREIMLTVDRRALVDVLEEAIPASARARVWSEKADARVVLPQLARSAAFPGEYALLTCAHCEVPQDLLLAPFLVRHDGEWISWRVTPPGANIFFEGEHAFALRFHRPQYEQVIARVLQEPRPSRPGP